MVGLASSRGSGDMPVGPTVRRRRLGSELRRLRESQSIKLEEVAERLGLAPSTLSRIETGKAPTRTAYLNALLELYGVTDPGQRQVLQEMAREGHRKGWWAVWDGVLPTGFGIYVGLEAEAASLRVYEAQVVHGLLQTEDYARAVMSTVRRRQTPEEIERLVRLRMQRQAVLHRAEPLELWLILDEAVLRRMAGSSCLMRTQLDYLEEASQWPNVTLQVLAFASGLHPGLGGSFAIIEFPERLDPDVVYTEGVTGQAYIEERDREVRASSEAFDLLRASALPPAESAQKIRSISARSTRREHSYAGLRLLRRSVDHEPRVQLLGLRPGRPPARRPGRGARLQRHGQACARVRPRRVGCLHRGSQGWRLRPAALAVELAVAGAAHERIPLRAREDQCRAADVAGVADRHAAAGEERDLDAVAAGRPAIATLDPPCGRLLDGLPAASLAH